MAIENVRIPVAYAPAPDAADLEGSLYEVLAARYRIVASAASVLIEPTLADERSPHPPRHRRDAGVPAAADGRRRPIRPRRHARLVPLPGRQVPAARRGHRQSRRGRPSAGGVMTARSAGARGRRRPVDGPRAALERCRRRSARRQLGRSRHRLGHRRRDRGRVARRRRPADVAVLGLTTVPDGPAECDRLATLVARCARAPTASLVCDDGITAHAGALGGSWGVALAVGTGVACVAAQPRRSDRPSSAATATSSATKAARSGSAGRASPRPCAPPTAAASAPLSTAAAANASAISARRTSASTPTRAPSTRSRSSRPRCSPPPAAAMPRRRRSSTRRSTELVDCVRAGWSAAGREPRTPLAIIGRLGAELRPELDEALAATRRHARRAGAGRRRRSTARCSSRDSDRAADYGSAVHTWTKG